VGHSVDYVDEWSHLGHTVSAVCDGKANVINRLNILVNGSTTFCVILVNVSLIKWKLLFVYCIADMAAFYETLTVLIAWRKGLLIGSGGYHLTYSTLYFVGSID